MDIFNEEYKPIYIILIIALILLFSFGGIFYIINLYFPNEGLITIHNTVTFFDALYFSIVTFTTLGYGDILPIGLSRIISLIEVIVGLIIFGILISKIVSIKQERFIQTMYVMLYSRELRENRMDLSDLRYRLNEIVNAIVKNPRNKELWTYTKSQLLKDNTLLTYIDSKIQGMSGFIKYQSEYNKDFKNNIDKRYINRLVNSFYLTIKELNTNINKLKEINYPINNSIFRKKVKGIANNSICFCNFVKELFDSKEITKSCNNAIKISEKCLSVYKKKFNYNKKPD